MRGGHRVAFTKLLFLKEAMDSSMVKTYVLCVLPLPRFPSFYLEGTTGGTGSGGNLMGQGLGNMEDVSIFLYLLAQSFHMSRISSRAFKQHTFLRKI